MVLRTNLQKSGRVIAVISHHDFSDNAPQRLMDSDIEVCITTDTIALPPEYDVPKLKEISISPVIADELRYLFE